MAKVEIDDLAGPDGGDEGKRLAYFWRSQLDKVKDDPKFKRWIKRGETIEKRYRDERSRVSEEGQRRYNALWSNVEILTPAIYGKCPVPIAERRFKDKDPTGRGAAQILERALRNEIEINGFDDAIYQAVRDYLLPGRGTVWVRYEPEIEEGISVITNGELDLTDNAGEIVPEQDPDSTEGEDFEDSPEGEEEEKLRQTSDRIVRESAPVDYVHWQDFITLPNNARVWREVTAVCKRVYMTRDQMKRRFGPIVGKGIPLRKDDRNQGKWEGPDEDPDDKGIVYEIWSLPTKEVFWVAEGYDYLCDRKDDPLGLENFFPCPKPLYANATTGTLYPVPDYIEYQDQAIQIDELTQRISMLSKACKVAGVYNAAAKDVVRLLEESVENELIPVDDWAAFAEKGGVAGNISLLPLKEIIGVLNELMQIKDKCILEMDRLTGITDIMRGTTDARETLGGQRLKTNSAGTRLQKRQNEVARFCRDVVRLMSDVMSQHFSDQSLIEVSGALYEEGLGEVDMTGFDNPQQPPPQLPQQQAMPMLPPPGAGAPQPPMPNMPPQPGAGGALVPQGPASAPPFPPEILSKLLGLQRIKNAIQLIRDERMRGFRIDIEVDSTIFGDLQQEKGDRTQFITAITGFLQQSMVLSQGIPQIAPLLGKILQFGVRGFHVGRDLEAAIEDFCDEAVGIAKQKAAQAQQQPAPQALAAQAQVIKATSQAKAADAKTQLDHARLQLDVQKEGSKIQSEREQNAAEIQRQREENAGEQANNAADIQGKHMDLQMKQMEMDLERMRVQFESLKMARESMKPMENIASESGESNG